MDPDGQPVQGASVRLMILGGWSIGPDLRTTSGPGGRFVLAIPSGASDRVAEAAAGTPRVVATSPGFGLGWADPEDRKELTVRLVPDLPIEGRIVNAEGRPIAGVKVKTHNAWASPKEDLAAFIENVKGHGWSPWEGARPLELIAYDSAATTDLDGRFRLEGIGRERVAGLTLSGPTIVTEDVYAMTRSSPAVRPVGWEGLEPGARSYRGARFEHAAAPCQPIVGTVRDVETGRPIAGVKVRGEVESVEGQARPRGRIRDNRRSGTLRPDRSPAGRQDPAVGLINARAGLRRTERAGDDWRRRHESPRGATSGLGRVSCFAAALPTRRPGAPSGPPSPTSPSPMMLIIPLAATKGRPVTTAGSRSPSRRDAACSSRTPATGGIWGLSMPTGLRGWIGSRTYRAGSLAPCRTTRPSSRSGSPPGPGR